MNTRSSTEAELVGADEAVGPMIWTALFMESQGYPILENILHQDNTSTILLEKNGRKSARKRTRHLHIRLFYITDPHKKGHIKIKYCPTEEMTADYMSKPLTRAKFKRFQKKL